MAVALTVFIFAATLIQGRPLLSGLAFALAIAVGIAPQLLPAIVTTCLASGARMLGRQGVLVKRLVCIEDLGNLDVLVTDKTGTLTDGHLTFERAVPAAGHGVDDVTTLGLLACAIDVTAPGAANVGQDPLDEALTDAALAGAGFPRAGVTRLDARPFDHVTRTTSVLVRGLGTPPGTVEIMKGAPEAVLAQCSGVADADRAALDALFAAGARVVAVASRAADSLATAESLGHVDAAFALVGFLSFLDRPKADAAASMATLAGLGVRVTIATGDNATVARKVCTDLGIDPGEPLTGDVVDTLTDDELYAAAQHTALLARVSPDQKARFISVLRRHHAVGFLGDGVNDAPSLHRADVGISVDSAVDVAKDAADVVLLDKDLGVVAEAIIGGRRVFANTIKYVQMGTSSNFGNMFSAALASMFLPFLPMTPGQILANNLLYDASQLAIPTDKVDDEQLRKPSHWDIAQIRRFMVIFGPISSIFDFATFGLMLWMLHAGVPEFQAGWFVESLATQTLIVFVIRTRRIPFWRSRPGRWLFATVLGVVALGAALPYTPIATQLGFHPLPPVFFLALVAMVACYLVAVEAGKAFYFRWQARADRAAAARADTRLAAMTAPASVPPTAPAPARVPSAERHRSHLARRARRFAARPPQ